MFGFVTCPAVGYDSVTSLGACAGTIGMNCMAPTCTDWDFWLRGPGTCTIVVTVGGVDYTWSGDTRFDQACSGDHLWIEATGIALGPACGVP